jgi:hypothetical protein
MAGNAVNNALGAQELALLSISSKLKSDPQQLNTFLQTQHTNVIDNIKKQKGETYDKLSRDLTRSAEEQGAFQGYNMQTAALSSLYDNIYNNQTSYADAVERNNNTYGRKFELNEWSINNKRDTLFVYSFLFISLSAIILITVLYKMNVMSSSVYYIMASVIILVFVLVVINRAVYTDQLRNKQYWNKKDFPGKYGKIPVPSICPPPSCPPSSCPPSSV